MAGSIPEKMPLEKKKAFYLVKQELKVKWVYVRVRTEFLDIMAVFVDVIVENFVC